MIKNLRIPYQGSKNKISLNLIHEMRKYKPKARYFYDLFGGGGSMSFTAIQLGYNVIYNEFNTDLANFMQFIIGRIRNKEKSKYGLLPDEYYKFVTRKIFMDQKLLKTNYAEFCRLVYSFGNDGKSYMFGKEIEEIKKQAHEYLYKNGYNGTVETRVKLLKQFKKDKNIIGRLELGQLQQLQQLQQLERLERLEQLEIFNKSYQDITIKQNDEDIIIYCDPPYRKTKGYRNNNFNFNEFDKWILNHDKTIFISEYETPFYEIFNIDKICTMSATNSNKKTLEKLFCNKNLKLRDKQLTLF